MIDPLSQAKEYGQGKKIQEMRSRVPIGGGGGFQTPPEHLLRQQPSQPQSTQGQPQLEADTFQPDPMADIPREQQNALYRAEMWRQVAETPGASDLAMEYFEAAINDLRKYKGDINVETGGADNERPKPSDTIDKPEEDRVSR
ncbi:hypothetical protein [Candidatus Oleimmundimicrobium sp.]|uniref:hypothetical protein n=1 Tax=Candidatus Oleimmundimicrobium sp. TaxID=3060597 RepID=UPI0027268CF2|nr:hypothetical protein [Candidatus Oleimmundimicrobium sp.]MDO8885731.1 hypothetical protein [Candidatus Oleimmundimicrobium sp.]